MAPFFSMSFDKIEAELRELVSEPMVSCEAETAANQCCSDTKIKKVGFLEYSIWWLARETYKYANVQLILHAGLIHKTRLKHMGLTAITYGPLIRTYSNSGRDGVAFVYCLYYTRSDFAKGSFYCGELQTKKQRKAVMESLVAAERYCLLTTCRRKFLLEYFGEIFSADRCGNCDNCIVSKKQRDMSTEAFLLLACIQSCRGKWGLNMPIDILRGSRAKKILGGQFDKHPLHGLGKAHPSNWWKALGHQLIYHGILNGNNCLAKAVICGRWCS